MRGDRLTVFLVETYVIKPDNKQNSLHTKKNGRNISDTKKDIWNVS